MRASLVVLAVLYTSLVSASHHSHDAVRHARHTRSNPLEKRAISKRCARTNKYVKATSTSTKKHHHTSTTAWEAPSSTWSEPAATGAPVIAAVNNAETSDAKTSDAKSSKAKSSKAKSSWGIFGGSGSCGDSGATQDITATSGPMGSIEFFNCGIDGGGWNPPDIYMSDLHYVSLNDAIAADHSPFKACAAYTDIFNKYGDQYNIPSIMMASFALQESSCNPATTGGAGEAGLMQLTSDKCHDAPGGNCYDPDFNIMRATQYFSGLVSDHGGSLLPCIGQYNGWFKGMTFGQATAAKWTSCCRCQNNLDYLHQFLNGWMQNKDAYSSHLGLYFNLDGC